MLFNTTTQFYKFKKNVWFMFNPVWSSLLIIRQMELFPLKLFWTYFDHLFCFWLFNFCLSICYFDWFHPVFFIPFFPPYVLKLYILFLQTQHFFISPILFNLPLLLLVLSYIVYFFYLTWLLPYNSRPLFNFNHCRPNFTTL